MNDGVHRLLSPPRRIMEKKKEKLNGLLLKGPYTGFKHPSLLPPSSMTRTATENSPRLPSKPKGVLKLQGISHETPILVYH